MFKQYEPQFKYQKGDLFPVTEFSIQDGQMLHLNKLSEDWIVLFLYPQDLTPTCTKQACNLRDAYPILLKQGIKLFGVSQDSEKSHQKFIAKHKLPFDLIVDADHVMAKNLGVFGKKKFMGRLFDGIHRSTFILNKKREIHAIIYPVESGRHDEQVMETISVPN